MEDLAVVSISNVFLRKIECGLLLASLNIGAIPGSQLLPEQRAN